MKAAVPDPENRQAVWLALSEFYLDTELTDHDFDRIADVFRQSGYSLPVIKEIDVYEVFPLLQSNLLSPVGVWSGFDEARLIAGCERQFHTRMNPLNRLRWQCWNKVHYWMRRDCCEQLIAECAKLLTAAPAGCPAAPAPQPAPPAT